MDANRSLLDKAIFLIIIVSLIVFAGCSPASAQQNPSMLSDHFSKAEFNQRQQPLPLHAFNVDPQLVKKLESLRRICRNRPIIVSSGYRSPEYNATVGGVKRSQHMTGKAADIHVDGIDNRMLANYARIVGFTYVKIYSNHVHVDVR